MSMGTRVRRIGFLLIVLVMATTACSATETVTINEAAVTSATSTALRDNASTDAGNGAQDPNQDADDQAAPTATAESSGSDTSDTADDSAPSRVEAAPSGCVFTFVDDFGDIQIELAFTNDLPEQDDASAIYELYDGNGDLLIENTHFFEELAPREEVRIAVDTLTDEPVDRGARSGISCALIDVEPAPFGIDKFAPTPTDTCVFVEIDGFGDIQIELNVVSPLDTPSELAIDYALRGPGGVRFGDNVTFTEEVGPGQLSTTPDDTFSEMPDWVNQSTFTCEVLSIQGF